MQLSGFWTEPTECFQTESMNCSVFYEEPSHETDLFTWDVNAAPHAGNHTHIHGSISWERYHYSILDSQKQTKIKHLIHSPVHSEALLPILQEKYNGSLKCDTDILFNAAVWPEAWETVGNTHTHTHQGSMSTLRSVLTVWTEGDFYPLFFFNSPSATDGHKTAGFPISPREREIKNWKVRQEEKKTCVSIV